MWHEDVRRSLEVLDNVLAEFDDCIESWDSPTFPHKRLNLANKPKSYFKEILRHDLNISEECLEFQSADDNASQTISHAQEQTSLSSPPPIPKRSPTTRLSEKINSEFIFQFEEAAMDCIDSLRLDAAGDNISALSPTKHVKKLIAPLSTEKNDGEFLSIPNEPQPGNCSNCGCNMIENQYDMDKNSRSSVRNSPDVGIHSLKSSAADYSSLSPKLNNRYNENVVAFGMSSLDHKESIDNKENRCTNSIDKERIKQLNVKFQRIRELLRQNKIKPLEENPPTFVPLLPSSLNKDLSLNDLCDSYQNTSSSPKLNLESYCTTSSKLESNDSSPIYENISSSYNDDSISRCSAATEFYSLCSNCSSSSRLSPTVEDIPNLLPTDVLVRPQFGLSYSMEEDLNPGVKEIRQTSTPKSDVSSTSLFKAKESGLFSTFSNSASSLGYVSSQSDLELNNLSEMNNKVPLSSLKSVTLPNGLDRFPFYSSFQDNNSDSPKRSHSQKVPDSRPPEPTSLSSVELSVEQPKKRDFFSRFSRKDKKSVKK